MIGLSKRKELKTLAIDTSVLIAFLVSNDPHHERAVEDLKNVDILFLPAEVVVETALYLRHHGKSFKGLIELLQSDDVVVLPFKEEVLLEALRRTEKDKKHFVDMVIYLTAKAHGADFLTYDTKFLKRYVRSK